jgi:acyl-CoA thioester hydrolase
MSNHPGSDHPGGFLDGAVHRLPLRVYYEDTDATGIVFHVNFLRFAERGRTEMLRALGSGHSDLSQAEGVAFAVRRCEIDFRWPARLDDLLEVETRIVDIGGASIVFEQTIFKVDDVMAGPTDRRLLVRILLTVFCINPQARPVRLPRPVRLALNDLQARDAIANGRD